MNIIKRWVLKSCSARELQDELYSRPFKEFLNGVLGKMAETMKEMEKAEKEKKEQLINSLKVKWQGSEKE